MGSSEKCCSNTFWDLLVPLLCTNMCEGIYVGAVSVCCRLLRGTRIQRWVRSCRDGDGEGRERGALMSLLDGLVFKGSCKYFVFVLSGLTNEGFDHPRTIASKKTLCIPGWGPRFSEYV